MHDVWKWMGNNAIELVGLAATLALLWVTYVSTRAARDMANIAKDAAAESAQATQAAERSAQAALDAALVAQSQIEAQFEGRAIAVDTGGSEHVYSIEIQSTGDPVVVREVRIKRGFPEGEHGYSDEPIIENVTLTPVGESVIPKRLHPGERVYLSDPSMNLGIRFQRFILEIDYGFTEDSDGKTAGTRQLIISDNQII